MAPLASAAVCGRACGVHVSLKASRGARLTSEGLTCPLCSVQVFPSRLLPHPDALGVGVAGRGPGRHGAVARRVLGHGAGVGQVSQRVLLDSVM